MGQALQGAIGGSADVRETYHLQKVKLGEGEFGVVWRAVHKTSGEVVAMKQLSKTQLPTRGVTRADVEREIQLLGALRHDNIIRLFETFEDSESIYMAVEYCDGGDFGDKVLERGSCMSDGEVAAWIEQMVSAIAFMHEKHVCHRDIKPDNFLVSRGCRLKLADLGLAAACPPGELLTERCGTAAFMAPELYGRPKRSQGYGLPVDIWAAGVTMYMVMFGGKHPFLNARGTLNEKALHNGELDFRKAGFRGSLGLRSAQHSEEARRTCQSMVEVAPGRRATGPGLLERPWLGQASAEPGSGSGGQRMLSRERTSSGELGGGTSKLHEVKERVQRKIERLPTKLEEVGKRVSAKFSREEDNQEPPAASPSSVEEAAADERPQWTFGVRDGFCSYQTDSSDVLEEQYQAFCSRAGPSKGTVVSMGREVVVDFEGMHQRVKGSTGRVRPVRRVGPPDPDAEAARG